MTIDNERKACDAVARCLAGLRSAQRSDECSPEDDKAGPPVEYVFNLAGRTNALEHTLLERSRIRSGPKRSPQRQRSPPRNQRTSAGG